MKTPLLAAVLIGACLGMAAPAQQRISPGRGKAVIVAFLDEDRLNSKEGRAILENFQFYLTSIREIAKRDFPDIEFKLLKDGELFHLPDRTALNVQHLQPPVGYVFSAPGHKQRMLSGVQSDEDFACAAAAFFHRTSRACSK